MDLGAVIDHGVPTKTKIAASYNNSTPQHSTQETEHLHYTQLGVTRLVSAVAGDV